MKTTYQHRQDTIKRMEGSRLTRQYVEEECYRNIGDVLMVLQEYITVEFASALMLALNNRNTASINCLSIAYHDMVKKYSDQFDDDEDIYD